MSSGCKTKLQKSYYHSASAQPFLGKTVHELQDDVARQFPDRDALVFCESGKRISFKQFLDDTNQLASDLVKLGLKPGERVCLWMGDGYEWMLLNLAATRAGLIALELAESQSVDHLRYTINQTKCSAMFVGFSLYNQYDKLKQVSPDIESDTTTLSRVPSLRYIITFDDDCPLIGCSIVMHEGKLRGRGGLEEYQVIKDLKSKVSADDPYMITFTSGSTGHPKPVVRTHRGTLENMYALKCHATHDDQSITRVLKLGSLVSSCGLYQAMLLMWGATLVSPRPTEDFTGALEAIEKEKCNFALLFPQYLSQAVNQQNIAKFDVSSLKRCNVLNAVNLLCGNAVVLYGTRETLYISIGDVSYTLEDRIRGKTRVLGHCEVKITDTDKRIMPVNTTDDIWVRGPYHFQWYYGDKERTEKVKHSDGWYYTGDLGQMDENGRLVILGRRDDMIVKGSHNVFPAEITNFLGDHPKVKDAQVVPVPDEKYLSEICLCLVLKKGSICTDSEMIEFLTGKVSPFSMPGYILFFDKFPGVCLKVNQRAIMKEAITRLGL
ncbi:medium-chain acyl-CoA ligase ACSF2, mitochondrial-like [Saccoglossus kowalevskii]|uniref:Acyl-CoA synthetase family member 2, mitochondrial-like n=1 Tax=Saccoglossus kowalevskii TaxID=10224 RepID=A0ABM0GYC4_SACKO|nr:PREDICTED: acyl-CoA synthetase family member 2, mitochondrial-like [Saccoglossus kowalevskii]